MSDFSSIFKFNFPKKLEEGIFQGRFKRFFAQIQTPKGEITAHLPNTGSLRGVNIKGMPCLYSKSDDPNRKLAFTLEAIQSESGVWVGINTQTPNRIIKQVLLEKFNPAWAKFEFMKPEYSISKETRFDFALSDQTFEVEKKSKTGKAAPIKSDAAPLDKKTGPLHLIEVKNVTMLEKRGDSKTAMFPDSVTERGQKHMRELGEMSQRGFSSEIVYFIQRSDAESFDVADHIDPEYAKIYRTVTKGQVKVCLAYCDFQRDGLSLKIKGSES